MLLTSTIVGWLAEFTWVRPEHDGGDGDGVTLGEEGNRREEEAHDGGGEGGGKDDVEEVDEGDDAER